MLDMITIEYRARVLGAGIKTNVEMLVHSEDLENMDELLQKQQTMIEMISRSIDDEERNIHVLIRDAATDERIYKLSHKNREGGTIRAEKRIVAGSWKTLHEMNNVDRMELAYQACELIEKAISGE